MGPYQKIMRHWEKLENYCETAACFAYWRHFELANKRSKGIIGVSLVGEPWRISNLRIYMNIKWENKTQSWYWKTPKVLFRFIFVFDSRNASLQIKSDTIVNHCNKGKIVLFFEPHTAAPQRTFVKSAGHVKTRKNWKNGGMCGGTCVYRLVKNF